MDGWVGRQAVGWMIAANVDELPSKEMLQVDFVRISRKGPG